MKTTVRLTESAVMLALATVLSMIPLAELPYGGSITACSMLPLVVIAYRHGVKWGVFTGFVHGLIQMLLGMKNVLYFTTPESIIAVIVLDYLLAFAAIGLAGVFRKAFKAQTVGMLSGALLASVLRYLFHVIAGATVWAGLSIPNEAALGFSLIYNLTYMLPETIVLLLGVGFVSNMLELRSESIGRAMLRKKFDWMCAVAVLCVVAALITDVVLVFQHLQDPSTGEFAVTGLGAVNWLVCGIVTAAAVVAAAVLMMVRRARKAKA